MLYVGIDPGIDKDDPGALAMIDVDSVCSELIIKPLPREWGALNNLLVEWVTCEGGNAFAAIETPLKIQNVNVVAVQMRQYGEICGALRARGVGLEEVDPRDWQRAILVRVPRGREKVKSAIRNWALGRWPENGFLRTDRCTKIWQGACDAAALAEYARMRAGGYNGGGR